MSNRGNLLRRLYTGVSLPLRLLLFVYYNLDTIISFSSSRRSLRRYRCLLRALYLHSLLPSLRFCLALGRVLSRVPHLPSFSLFRASKCRWRARQREKERKRNAGRRMGKRGKANQTETETYNKVSGRVRREWNCVVWCGGGGGEFRTEKVFVGSRFRRVRGLKRGRGRERER